jgi:signal transduction histidine kinase
MARLAITKSRLKYYSKIADIKDSVYQQNSAEAMSELKTKYEVQKKENTIILQQLDLVKKDYLLYSSVLLFILAAVIIYFVFRNYKRRQKQKATAAVALAEESERKRLAADLHDNLGAYAASIASNVSRLSFSAENSQRKQLPCRKCVTIQTPLLPISVIRSGH